MRRVLWLRLVLLRLGEHKHVPLPVVGPHGGCQGTNIRVSEREEEGGGGHAHTWAASTTLLCLNGLKSSLMCAAVFFLIGRVPKNGFGAAGAYPEGAVSPHAHHPKHTRTSDFGFGDTDADAMLWLEALGLGDGAPCNNPAKLEHTVVSGNNGRLQE